jgi:aryl-alcohol dehydrogenase-like predicted oxidoreductase
VGPPHVNVRLAKGLKGARDQVFIATTTKECTRDGALKNLDWSLKRLRTDHIDIWQLPGDWNLEHVDQIFGKGGAIEALVQARDQKIVRHLGLNQLSPWRGEPSCLYEHSAFFCASSRHVRGRSPALHRPGGVERREGTADDHFHADHGSLAAAL